MFSSKTPDHHNGLAQQAEQSAEQAVRATQRVANEALDSLAVSVQDLRHQAAPMLQRANEQAVALARRGVEAVRDGSQHLRDSAHRASDHTASRIRDDPFKAVLIAAAAGAALVALIGLTARSRN